MPPNFLSILYTIASTNSSSFSLISEFFLLFPRPIAILPPDTEEASSISGSSAVSFASLSACRAASSASASSSFSSGEVPGG